MLILFVASLHVFGYQLQANEMFEFYSLKYSFEGHIRKGIFNYSKNEIIKLLLL